jgi:tetratricopeptide (TPR) repeat protein
MVELSRKGGVPMLGQAYTALASAQFTLGLWDEAIENDRAAVANELEGAWRNIEWAYLLLHLAYVGRRDEALAMYAERRELLPQPGHVASVGSRTLLVCAVEALAILGERHEAAALYPVVLDVVESGNVWRIYDGQMIHTIAGIAAAAGRHWDAAEKHFEVAIRTAQELADRIDDTHARRFYARMLLDRDAEGDRVAAQKLLIEALETYRDIGMPKHVEMTDALLAAATS